jgi:translation elongation factor aEF-1 beta
MGKAVVTISIMPQSPETDLDKITVETAKMVREFAGEGDTKVTIEPIAFGLKCIKYIFVMDEMLGSPDTVAERILKIHGVESAEITDVRRAIG